MTSPPSSRWRTSAMSLSEAAISGLEVRRLVECSTARSNPCGRPIDHLVERYGQWSHHLIHQRGVAQQSMLALFSLEPRLEAETLAKSRGKLPDRNALSARYVQRDRRSARDRQTP